MADTVKITDAGLDITTNRLKGSGTEPSYIGWGTGTTAAAVGNTALETARGESRTNGTTSRVTTNTTNDTYQNVGTITCASTSAAITEMGLFDASTNGNMYMRATFSAINVSVGDSIQFTAKAVYDN
jgi:hypothetical protein